MDWSNVVSRKKPRRCAHVRRGQCWACYKAEQQAAALFGVEVLLCQHCGQNPVNRSRGLCWHCYRHEDIRKCYPAFVRGSATPKLDKLPLLPVLAVYPDHSRCERCPHGHRDGECP